METPDTPLHGVRALNFEERNRVFSSTARARLSPDVETEAARTVRWWEKTYFLGHADLFTRRLKASGLNRSTVLPLVAAGRPAATSGDLELPDGHPRWPLEVAEDEPETRDTGRVPDGSGVRGVLVPNAWRRVEPVIDALEEACRGLSVDRDAVRTNFVDYLTSQLLTIAMQTLVLELHLAKRSGRLVGADAESRYKCWTETQLDDPVAFRGMLARYPVLARALVTATVAATAAWTEMLTRLGQDWALLGPDLGRLPGDDRLIGVETGMGDTHRGGRSVMCLAFDSGWRVVYKPRPMAVDGHFQDLIRWLGQRGLTPSLKTVGVLDRREYGWMEFVTAGPCRTATEVQAFYRRQGALLAVLYLVDAMDNHAENIMAVGEHPVLVDLETLFQARPRPIPPGSSPTEYRHDVFHSTVLRTLVLPLQTSGTAGSVDVSALTELAGQLTSYRVLNWRHAGTDRLKIVHERVDLEAHHNLPHLEDRSVPAVEHLDDIAAGFTDAYRLVLDHRPALLHPDGPLHAFAGDRVRHVLRDTAQYGLLLEGSLHASCLRDAIQRDFVLDTLWMETRHRPYLAPLIPSERDDLWAGDIPYFSAKVNSTDLLDSRDRVIPDFLASSGLDRVLARVRAFGGDDLARQLVCIRGTVTTSTPPPPVAPMAAAPDREAAPDELLAAATRIGERLSVLAFRQGDEAHWTADIDLPGNARGWSVVGPDLYEGTAGIALFLAHLAAATGRGDFRELAGAAYAGVANQIRGADLGGSVGAFLGVPGMLHVASQLASLWDEPALAEEAMSALDHVARRVRTDTQLDYLGGTAGCLVVMLRLAERFPESRAQEIANLCGRRLLSKALRVDGGLAWPGEGATQPLLGLSHGTAGMAWALAELSAATGDDRYARAARAAVRYERSHFDRVLGNWPDFRVPTTPVPNPDEPQWMWAWCHGAPGLGMARMAMRQRGAAAALDDDIDGEIEAALASTDANGFNGGHNLCHGDLGNAELFVVASQVYGEPGHLHAARRRAHAVLADEEATGAWRCNPRDFGESPGLMLGLAGIGYGLLRIRDPQRVPSVMMLGNLTHGPASEVARPEAGRVPVSLGV